MSEVEQFTGGANWKLTHVLSQTLKRSKPFKLELDGQQVSFTLGSAYVPAQNLVNLFDWHKDNVNNAKLELALSQEYPNRTLAIYVKSSRPIESLPRLELKAVNGAWFNVPINWVGPDGITFDRKFFGATNFMNIATLRDEYITKVSVKRRDKVISISSVMVRCTILEPSSGPIQSPANAELVLALEKMFEDGLWADIVLVSESKEMKVSKNILAARSPVFAAMFLRELEETKTGRVNITDVEYEPLRGLVKFLYTGTIELDDVEFALKVLVAADKYDVQSLKNVAEDYIRQNIAVIILPEALKISQSLNSEVVKTACLDLIVKMKESDVAAIPGFEHLDRVLLIEMIRKLTKTLNG